MTSSLSIRAAQDSDIPAIVEIYNHAVLHTTATADYEPTTVEVRLAWLHQRQAAGYAVLVAEREGKIVGWAALNPMHPKPGYRFSAENSIYIAAECQRQGIGRQLLAHLLECAEKQGLHSVLASIDSTNTASIALHQKFGFVEVARIPEVIFKFDRWLDVVYLQKRLPILSEGEKT
jgi:L-amino acid N-acyltransferase